MFILLYFNIQHLLKINKGYFQINKIVKINALIYWLNDLSLLLLLVKLLVISIKPFFAIFNNKIFIFFAKYPNHNKHVLQLQLLQYKFYQAYW
jgi:hypothetical protein